MLINAKGLLYLAIASGSILGMHNNAEASDLALLNTMSSFGNFLYHDN